MGCVRSSRAHTQHARAQSHARNDINLWVLVIRIPNGRRDSHLYICDTHMDIFMNRVGVRILMGWPVRWHVEVFLMGFYVQTNPFDVIAVYKWNTKYEFTISRRYPGHNAGHSLES